MDGVSDRPTLSVVMPTFNNERVLRQAVESWRRFGGAGIELIVIEDGCRDGTVEYLREAAATPWGRGHLRWIDEDEGHELRCTNRGMSLARAPIIAAWQDDMFLRASWFATEVVETFRCYPDLGLLALSRGLDCVPCADPVERWDDLIDGRRLRSTLGPPPLNWFRLQEVDGVIRPWIVRRECLERVGMLDEAFRPTEWDETDLAFRIREAGWKVATHGYERLGAYVHLGSSTIGEPSDGYKARVLANGLLFHERWDATIARTHGRARKTWWRTATPRGWLVTAGRMAGRGLERMRGRA
jgi:GT2 family glycosyltransferase